MPNIKTIRMMISSLCLCLLALLSTTPLQANFIATPMEFRLSEDPGTSTEQRFWVRNQGEKPIRLKIYSNDFAVKPNGKEQFLEPGEHPRSCAPWLSIAPLEIELQSKQSIPVRFRFDIPSDALGTYWAMIFVEQVDNPNIEEQQTGQQSFQIMTFQRMGVRLFLNVNGAYPEFGLIENIQIVRPENTENQLQFEVLYHNPGKVLTQSSGTIEIFSDQGESMKQLTIDTFNSYPQASRTVRSLLEEPLNPGSYLALVSIDDGGDELVGGELSFEVQGQ